MIVILEGPDLAGKTTIASELGRRVQMPVVHPWMDLTRARYSAVTIARTLGNLLQALPSLDLIFDRLHFSEYVYAQLWGRAHDYLPSLFAEWNVPRTYLVLVTAKVEVLADRLSKRGDSELRREDLSRLVGLYGMLPKVLPQEIQTFRIDTSSVSVDETIRELLEILPIGTRDNESYT